MLAQIVAVYFLCGIVIGRVLWYLLSASERMTSSADLCLSNLSSNYLASSTELFWIMLVGGVFVVISDRIAGKNAAVSDSV